MPLLLDICPRIWYNTAMQTDMEGLWRTVTAGETGEKFAAFYAMLTKANAQFNLTRITGEEECRVKHFLDSLAGMNYFPQDADCCEVGSGAGFPSVPLLIARGDLAFTLIESSQKKCRFLETVIKELGLRASVVCARAEEAAKGPLRERFDVCCARAVARLNTLAEYCLPFVKKGGAFIAYKGNAAEEMEEAKGALRILGGAIEEAHAFDLPQGAGRRTILVCRKISHTPPQYPRGHGKERTSPL